jgi:DnaJ-class molecular chaperone
MKTRREEILAEMRIRETRCHGCVPSTVICRACGGEGIEHQMRFGFYSAHVCRSCGGKGYVEVEGVKP